jgi:hypothetical protein
MLRRDAHAIDLAREREHDGQSSPIVVDSWTNEPLSIAANREIRLSREDGVKVSTDDDGRQVGRPFAASDHVANSVGLDFRESTITKAASNPLAALLYFASRRGDMLDGILRSKDCIVVRRKTRMRGRERTMRCTRGGRRRRMRSHAFNSDTRPLPRKW